MSRPASIVQEATIFSKATKVCFHDDAPDKRGRRCFTALWLADYHPGHPAGENRIEWRGQVFHCVPPVGVVVVTPDWIRENVAT